MNPALLWKEWREQRTFAVAVLVFGFLAMVGTVILVDPAGGKMGPRELMPVAIAYLAGMVCGAMLIADEKEVGTLEFLDSLPSNRRKLWQSKILFGMGFSMLQCLLIGVMATTLGCYDLNTPPLAWIIVSVLIGWVAFAWGCFGGATTNSTLGAVFLGSVGCVVSAVLLAVPFSCILGAGGTGGYSTTGPSLNYRRFGFTAIVTLLYPLIWVGCGLLGSIYFFTQLDRERKTHVIVQRGHVQVRRSKQAGSLRALVWLALRQARLLTYILFGTAALMAGIMLIPETMPLFMWPSITLIFGTLAGVTIFTEEQGKGIARFWSERRLPIGRLWFVKVALHFLLAACASLLILVVLYIADSQRPLRSELFNLLRREQLRFLLITLVYGFVCAHLASLLFRKTIVAGLVAVIFAVTMAGALIPSLVAGGLHGWQLWSPALIMLITARYMLYPWAHGRILMRTPLLRVGGGIMLALLTLIGGLIYRIVEIPNLPDRLEEARFVENLPIKDRDEAGSSTRSAVSQFHKASDDARSLLPPPKRNLMTDQNRSPMERLRQYGWSPETADLKPWLDRIFADPWLKHLDDAATKPVGIFDYPPDLDALTPVDSIEYFRDMIVVLRVRGLQLQAEGNPDAFIRLARGGLTAIRAARNKAGQRTVNASLASESLLLSGIQRWLAKLPDRPDLLTQMLAELVRHEREMPTDSAEMFWADQVILRNTNLRIANLLPKILRQNPTPLTGVPDPGDTEADFVGICWSFPWERLRRERLERCLSQQERVAQPHWFSPLHLFYTYDAVAIRRFEQHNRAAITARRIALLQVALHLYQTEHKHFPNSLDKLVPQYLDSVPLDALGKGPINYRVVAEEKGEKIELEEEPLPNLSLVQGTVCEGLVNLAQPLGGLNWLTEFYDLIPDQPDQVPDQQPDFGPPRPTPFTQRRIVTVPKGQPILWSVGSDGVNDDGRRGPRQRGWQTLRGEDWIFLMP